MNTQFHIDAPVRNPRKTVYAPAIVAGWFVDEELRGAVQVRARVDSRIFICERVDRPDLAAKFAATSLPRTDVGFLVRLPDDLPPGRLTIEAETVSSKIVVLRNRSLTIKQWPPRPSGLRGWLANPRQTKAWARPAGSDDSVLVLIPVKPGTDPAIIAQARTLAERALAVLPAGTASRIVFDDRGRAPDRQDHAWRIAALAAIRQGMIETHLRDERWVFWPDIDLVDYLPDLIANLIRRSEGGIAAPMIFMDKATSSVGGPLFYDVAGFVEQGHWATSQPPYFKQRGPVYDLESVGSCYLVPADLYRRGARHEEDPGSRRWIETRGSSSSDTQLRDWTNQSYTEHYSVCSFARQNGLPVRAFADLIAVHEHV
ncbi:hypothetical protein [Rariglobus hedericola]|uniref:Uncharacterized protein n=1 Tax=Rariglobus hedericola TaxID=2597822 RepID=A0A556QJ57_9BACT|nr:hypothetical protein [Rariglobus hedericola]TSJ76662.1 hypothetical protein FPL22_11075 [Rariglobus hedericola]